MNDKKKAKKYSQAEVKAYYMGQGAAIGWNKAGGIVNFQKTLSPELKKSFNNGFDDALVDKKIKLKRK